MSPLIIGHRGASAHAPENTIAAFSLALADGADGIEFDVRLSRDGFPVVIHDDNLKRTGLVPRLVRDLDLLELKKVDVGSWFGASFVNEPIPTLQEVLRLVEPTNAILYLEMKSARSDQEQLAKVCCDSLRATNVRDRVFVECFDLEALQLVKQFDPEIKTVTLFEPKISQPSSLIGRLLIDNALSVAASAIALHHRLASTTTVEAARRAGLGVVVWTVDDPAWIARAKSEGIDALITNDPGLFVRERDSSATN